MQQPTNNCTVLFSHVAPLSNVIDAACCYYPSYPPPYPQQKAQAQWQWQSANWNKKQKRETKRRKQEARGGGVSVRVRVSLGFFAPQEKLGARLRTTPYTIQQLHIHQAVPGEVLKAPMDRISECIGKLMPLD